MNGILNRDEIKRLNLLEDTIENNYKAASYDLSIGKIFSIENRKEMEEYIVPPQGMVLLFSKESFNMPENVIGYTTIKNRMSIKGLLALNIGLVDPSYNGKISSIIINFGNNPVELKKDMTFLRMTFHEFNKNKKQTIDKYEVGNYYEVRINEVLSHLDSKFMSLDKTKKEITREITKGFIKRFSWGIVILTLIIAILTFIFDYIKLKNNENEIKILKYELQEMIKKEINNKQKKNK